MPTNYICLTCGVQHAAHVNDEGEDTPPQSCAICNDERQYVGLDGQQWTTLEELRADHHNELWEEGPGLIGIRTEPKFAIGQRALLVQTSRGNILWDCITHIDDDTVKAIKQRGGLTAIAISHPHFFDTMVEWSKAFDVPIYLHADHRPYVMRPDPAIAYWKGNKYPLNDEVTLIRCGGHFTGSTALHWANDEIGGALLTADTIMIIPDRKYVSFMYSYPNLIPLPAKAIRGIAQAVEPYAFERIYGGWQGSIIYEGGKDIVLRSAERYIKMIEG